MIWIYLTLFGTVANFEIPEPKNVKNPGGDDRILGGG